MKNWFLNSEVPTLMESNLSEFNPGNAEFIGADLCYAGLRGADLYITNLTEAYFRDTDIGQRRLMETDLTDAVLTDCRIYGISVWDVKKNTE